MCEAHLDEYIVALNSVKNMCENVQTAYKQVQAAVDLLAMKANEIDECIIVNESIVVNLTFLSKLMYVTIIRLTNPCLLNAISHLILLKNNMIEAKLSNQISMNVYTDTGLPYPNNKELVGNEFVDTTIADALTERNNLFNIYNAIKTNNTRTL